MLEIGSPAPDFTLPDDSRDPVTLSSFRDKSAVVLAFYPAAFTGVCQKELCTFRDSLGSLNEVDATVLGISVDSPMANAAFAKQNELNFPLLSDYSRTAVNAYGVALENFAGMDGYVAAQRAVFVVDKAGTIRYAWIAPNPGVEPDYEAVKAAVDGLS